MSSMSSVSSMPTTSFRSECDLAALERRLESSVVTPRMLEALADLYRRRVYGHRGDNLTRALLAYRCAKSGITPGSPEEGRLLIKVADVLMLTLRLRTWVKSTSSPAGDPSSTLTSPTASVPHEEFEEEYEREYDQDTSLNQDTYERTTRHRSSGRQANNNNNIPGQDYGGRLGVPEESAWDAIGAVDAGLDILRRTAEQWTGACADRDTMQAYVQGHACRGVLYAGVLLQNEREGVRVGARGSLEDGDMGRWTDCGESLKVALTGREDRADCDGIDIGLESTGVSGMERAWVGLSLARVLCRDGVVGAEARRVVEEVKSELVLVRRSMEQVVREARGVFVGGWVEEVRAVEAESRSVTELLRRGSAGGAKCSVC